MLHFLTRQRPTIETSNSHSLDWTPVLLLALVAAQPNYGYMVRWNPIPYANVYTALRTAEDSRRGHNFGNRNDNQTTFVSVLLR